MAKNITLAAGGGVVADGVVTYLPTCSSISYSDVSLAVSQEFDITDVDYLQKVIPTLAPGLIFGILSLAGFIFFIAWLCVQLCNQERSTAAAKQEAPNDIQAQFLRNGHLQHPQHMLPAQPARRWRAQPGFLAKVLVTAVAVAVAALSTWGLLESLRATNTTFSDLWEVVHQVQWKVSNTTSNLHLLHSQLNHLAFNASTLANQGPVLQTFVDQLGGNAAEMQQAVAALQQIPAFVMSFLGGIQKGVVMLDDNLGEKLADVQVDWEDVTLAFQEQWRFIPLAVVFGSGILISLLCALLYWRLHWYRTATVCTALLWLNIAVLMLLGVGLLKGVYTISTDSCKYAEALALDLAQRRVAPAQRELVRSAFSYYFGLTYLPDRIVAERVLGVPTYKLQDLVSGPLMQLANLLSNSTQAQAALSPQAMSAVANISQILPNVSATVLRLEQGTLKRSVDPLYRSAKEYICCQLSADAFDMWRAWTAVGAVGFVMAALCSARFAHHTVSMRKWKRKAAVLASWPPDAVVAAPEGKVVIEAGSDSSLEGGPVMVVANSASSKSMSM